MVQSFAPSRRGVLRSSAALLLAGGMAASTVAEPPLGDVELLAACMAFAAAAREVARLEAIRETPDEVFEPANDALHDAIVRVAALPARTPAGVRAKAGVCRAVLRMDEPTATAGRFDVEARRHDVLAWSTLSDLVEVTE